MCQIFLAFIEPYSEDTQDREKLVRLVNLATLAWNFSFLPKRQQQKEIEQLLLELDCDSLLYPQVKKNLSSVLNRLTVRKRQFFSKHKRFILDCQVMDSDSEVNIFLVSAFSSFNLDRLKPLPRVAHGGNPQDRTRLAS